MSEQEKSGEDLIEKVEQETTGDAVEETKEESKEFDPKAFNANDTAVESKEELKEETEEEPVEDSDDDDFNWNSVESEAKEEKEEIKDDDWDSVEEEEVKPKSNVKRGYKTLKTLEEGQMYNIESLCMNHGLINAGIPWDVAFTSLSEKDKSYIMSLEKHGGLGVDPKINLSTIHMAKGS